MNVRYRPCAAGKHNITRMWAHAHILVMLCYSAALSNIGGALCEISVIQFLVRRRKVWLTPAAGVPCSNAANIGERKTWLQSPPAFGASVGGDPVLVW